MNHSKAVQIKEKVAKIYSNFTIVFIVIFSGISICAIFISALNF
ncbi:hypothetical protein POAN111098_04595 [Polynucleobacter antarcticus]